MEHEKIIHDTISHIRTEKRKRPDSELIIRTAAANLGLNEGVIRSSFDYLVESGSIYSKLTSDGKESFYIFKPEAFGEESDDDEVLYCGKEKIAIKDSMDKPSTPTSMSDFFAFLRIFEKLTEDIRHLNSKLDLERKNNDILRTEVCNLKLENLELKSSSREPEKNNELEKRRESMDNHSNWNIIEESIIPEDNVTKRKDMRPSKKKRDRLKTATNNTENMAGKKQLESSNQHNNDTNCNRFEVYHQEKRNKTAIIIGDSMVKNVQSWRLKAALKQNVKLRSFSGAKIADMEHYIKPAIEEKADLYIAHFGTNDLRTDQHPEAIAEKIVDVAMKMKMETNDVVISAICSRGDEYNDKASEVNKYLKSICSSRNIGLISNENIYKDRHLNNSRLHLNRSGDAILASNFRNMINKH